MSLTPMEAAPLAPSGNHKIWAILSHVSGLLGVGLVLPIIVYVAMRKDSAYVADNAREALNFHLSLLIYSLAAVPLVFALGLGILLLMGLGLFALVVSILAAIRASEGGCYRYPFCLRMVR